MRPQEGGKFIPEMEDGHLAVSEVRTEGMCTCGYRIPFVIINISVYALVWNVPSIAMLVMHRQLPYKASSSVNTLHHYSNIMIMCTLLYSICRIHVCTRIHVCRLLLLLVYFYLAVFSRSEQ